MPRNISYALTTKQFRDRSKDVTRRLGWKNVKVGEILNGCVKCMGLKPGEQIERLGRIRVVSARREPLSRMITDPDYGKEEARREGFPNMTGAQFVEMFCKHMRVDADEVVTRIEYEYIDPVEPTIPTIAEWLEGWEANVEAGQSTISRDEAERRYYEKYPRDNEPY